MDRQDPRETICPEKVPTNKAGGEEKLKMDELLRDYGHQCG